MIIGFADNGWEDYQYWIQNDKKIVKRINMLLEDIKINPNDSDGLGKPATLCSDESDEVLLTPAVQKPTKEQSYTYEPRSH